MPSKNLLIQETFANATENYIGHETEVYETRFSDVKALYKSLTSEYGRCTSKMYIDSAAGESKAIGWVFEKRVKYDDSKETFIQQVWVSVHTATPKKSIQYAYADLSRGAK